MVNEMGIAREPINGVDGKDKERMKLKSRAGAGNQRDGLEVALWKEDRSDAAELRTGTRSGGTAEAKRTRRKRIRCGKEKDTYGGRADGRTVGGDDGRHDGGQR
ncbi:hypothetical protein PIB30_030615 [Stylosanthes scabra]|uniref:Uncharacterized protein n=1 Tax=Stylosanthes scabra TaxID=79078 RepID=A0ABU6X9R1_9FABA|nr:hypothetical protein [Stylosanthes scabra]